MYDKTLSFTYTDLAAITSSEVSTVSTNIYRSVTVTGFNPETTPYDSQASTAALDAQIAAYRIYNIVVGSLTTPKHPIEQLT